MKRERPQPSAIMPSPAPEHSQHHGGIAAHPLTRRKRVVGLDLGTSKVAAVVGESDDFGNISIIGVGEAPTEGLRKGVVVNIDKTVGSITAAAQSAERMAGVRFDSVIVSLAGSHLSSQNSRGVIAVSRDSHEIGQEDVERVVDASRAVSVPSDREVVHVIPRSFTVDGQDGVKEAMGMTGTRLEVETHIVTGAQTSIQNVIKCVHQAGFDVDDVVSQGLASGQAVLSPNEMELGVCLIDIGAGPTDVVGFRAGSGLPLAVPAVGGHHVHRPLATAPPADPTAAELTIDVDFTIARPGPDLGPEGYRRLGERYGLTLDPERYDDARRAAFATLKRHPELGHDEARWVLFTQRGIEGTGGAGGALGAAAGAGGGRS